MARRSRTALEKININLRSGDYQFLQSAYAQRNIKASDVVRALVTRHVDGLKEKLPPLTEMDLPDVTT